jgi:hypothetical protein
MANMVKLMKMNFEADVPMREKTKEKRKSGNCIDQAVSFVGAYVVLSLSFVVMMSSQRYYSVFHRRC